MDHDPSEETFTHPLDAADPRFVGDESVALPERPRELVESQGPGYSPLDPRVRLLRGAVPLLFVAALVVIGAVFFRALAPGPSTVEVGEEAAVREAVSERPLRVCREDGGLPCAWLTVIDDRLIALSTSGSIREEYGRQGVGWCPSSGYFGSNTSGSRYDAAGTLVSGPALRSLDRYALRVREDGMVVVDFNDRSAGRRAGSSRAPRPPAGPECDAIPYDWNPDLNIDRRQ